MRLTGIVGLAAAILGAPSLINSFVQDAEKLPTTYAYVSAWVRGDKHFAGEWTNDFADAMKYSVGPPLEGLELQAKPAETSADLAEQGAVSLNLEVKDGLVTGEITSRKIRDTFFYSHLFVSGVVRFGTLDIHVWDYISTIATPIAGLKAHAGALLRDQQWLWHADGGAGLLRPSVVREGLLPGDHECPGWQQFTDVYGNSNAHRGAGE